MRDRTLFFFCLLLTVLLPLIRATPADADPSGGRPGVLRSASELDYPPFALVRGDGGADGFSVDLLRAAADAVGLDTTFRVGPWHEIKQALIEGRLDALPLVSYSRERDRVLDFTAPYMRLQGAVFVRKGERSIRSQADLKDKEVLTMRGDNAHEYAVKHHLTDKLILTDTYKDAMALLSSGKHDAVIMLQLVGYQLIKKLGITNVVSVDAFRETSLKPSAAPLAGFEQKFCFAVPEGDKELLARLNEGLAIVIANDTYNDLYRKWFGPILPQPTVSRTTIVKHVLYALFPILFLMSVAGVWYLKKEVSRKTEYLREEIEERKRAEEKIQRSETKFRTLFNAAAIPMCFVSDEGAVLDINDRFEKRFGYTRADIPTIDHWWRSAYPDPEYRRWVIDTWSASVGRSKKERIDIEPVEYTVRCKNGEVRNVIISGSTFQDHLLATFVDITDQKLVEERFQKIFSLISDIFCIADIDGYFRLINPAARDILGYGEEELLQKPFLEFVHPEDRESTKRVIEEKLEKGATVLHFQNRYLCKDGSFKWLEWTSHPMVDQGITFAVARDCTDRLKLEATIRESELWMRSIFNSLEEGVLVLSPEGRLINANGAAEEIFGYARDELADIPMERLHVDRDHFAAFGKKIEEAFGRGVAAEFEFQARRKNGEVFPTEHTVSLLKDDEGTPIGMVSVVRDITERKRAEKALRETVGELKRSNTELEQFAYVASHDLQEPLRAVAGFLQLLQARYADRLDEKGLHYIDRSVKAAHRMQNLILDLLTLSRVSTRGASFTSTDLNLVVRETVENLRPAVQEKAAEITWGDLPAPAVDGQQIQSLFQNLILNALKYNRSPKPTVAIDCRDQGDVFRFSVTDNGIGIDPKFHDKIFMVFQRLHTEREIPGTGLGLALCRKIVERHGGTIWVESAPGRGSTFHFTLPADGRKTP